jgi:hypothetical protein
MLSTDQMPPQIEKIIDSSMSCYKSLRLPHRLEPPHPSLPYPRRLIPDKAGQALRLLCPIILILFSAMN